MLGTAKGLIRYQAMKRCFEQIKYYFDELDIDYLNNELDRI